MPDEVLDGADTVAEALRARLEAQVPAELALLEAAKGRPTPVPEDLSDPDLWRPPGLYAGEDRPNLQADDYPALLVVVQHTNPSRVIDMVEGRATRVVPYVVRTWALCRHWGWAEVAAARNRLALGVESAYLRGLRLDAKRSIVADGWRTSYSDVGVGLEDERSYAGWWVEMVVEQTEHLGDPALAPLPGNDLAIDLRVHPAAD